MNVFEAMNAARLAIRTRKPVILNLTNSVTMDIIANGLLSLGAAPIMSCASEEIAEMTQIADAVVINLGTLNTSFMKRAKLAARCAAELKKPVFLDPVGAGASALRTEAAQFLLAEYPIACVRANASEVMALAGVTAISKGVESLHSTEHALRFVSHLSESFSATIAMSGVVDVVSSRDCFQTLSYGSERMTHVTGMGCLLTAVIAAFATVVESPFDAAVLACSYYGLCGETAAEWTQGLGPGSYRVSFLDTLSIPDLEFMKRRCDAI